MSAFKKKRLSILQNLTLTCFSKSGELWNNIRLKTKPVIQFQMASAGFSVLESRSLPSSNYISSYCSVIVKTLIKDDTAFDLSNQERFTGIVHSPGKSTLYDWHLCSFQQLCKFSQSGWEAIWQYMLTFKIFLYFDSQISI